MKITLIIENSSGTYANTQHISDVAFSSSWYPFDYLSTTISMMSHDVIERMRNESRKNNQ